MNVKEHDAHTFAFTCKVALYKNPWRLVFRRLMEKNRVKNKNVFSNCEMCFQKCKCTFNFEKQPFKNIATFFLKWFAKMKSQLQKLKHVSKCDFYFLLANVQFNVLRRRRKAAVPQRSFHCVAIDAVNVHNAVRVLEQTQFHFRVHLNRRLRARLRGVVLIL